MITVTLTGSKAGECFSKHLDRLASSSDTSAAASVLRAAQRSSHREKERWEQGSALTEIPAYCRQLKTLQGPLFTHCLYSNLCHLMCHPLVFLSVKLLWLGGTIQ